MSGEEEEDNSNDSHGFAMTLGTHVTDSLQGRSSRRSPRIVLVSSPSFIFQVLLRLLRRCISSLYTLSSFGSVYPPNPPGPQQSQQYWCNFTYLLPGHLVDVEHRAPCFLVQCLVPHIVCKTQEQDRPQRLCTSMNQPPTNRRY